MDKKEDVKPVHWTKQFITPKNLGKGKFEVNAFWPKAKPTLTIEVKKSE